MTNFFMLAKAATTYLGSHNNSGKDIAKNVALSAAGNLGAVTALALANKVHDKGHQRVAELVFSAAVAIYVCAQNSWNPFPVIKKLVLSPKETLRKFVSHRFSAEDIAKFVVNTGTLVACYKHTTKPAVSTVYDASSMQWQGSQSGFGMGHGVGRSSAETLHTPTPWTSASDCQQNPTCRHGYGHSGACSQ